MTRISIRPQAHLPFGCCAARVINGEGLHTHRMGPHAIYQRHKHMERHLATYSCR